MWHRPELKPQRVIVRFDRVGIDQEGNTIATGQELYQTGDHFQSIDVEVKVAPRTRRWTFIELPKASAQAQDSSVGEPFFGILSEDLNTVSSLPLENQTDASPELVLSSRRSGLEMTGSLSR